MAARHCGSMEGREKAGPQMWSSKAMLIAEGDDVESVGKMQVRRKGAGVSSMPFHPLVFERGHVRWCCHSSEASLSLSLSLSLSWSLSPSQ